MVGRADAPLLQTALVHEARRAPAHARRDEFAEFLVGRVGRGDLVEADAAGPQLAVLLGRNVCGLGLGLGLGIGIGEGGVVGWAVGGVEGGGGGVHCVDCVDCVIVGGGGGDGVVGCLYS